MIREIKVDNFNQVQRLMSAASSCMDDIGVHDANGSIADAKSILGLMSLDYTKPVKLVSENSRALDYVSRNVRS